MVKMLLQWALCDAAGNPSQKGTEKLVLLLCWLQNYRTVKLESNEELKSKCRLWTSRCDRYFLSSCSLDDQPEFLCAIELFLLTWSSEGMTILMVPQWAGAHPICIHLCSLLLMPHKHQNNGINLLELVIFAEVRGETCGSARCGLICMVLSKGLCPYSPKAISRIINLDNVPTLLH